MAVIQDININVHGQPSEKRLQTFLRLSQNENGRSINFRVLGAPLPSGCTATFAGTKPDGNVYSTTGTVAGNFVVVQEDMQMTAVAGVWDAKLDIVNGVHNIMSALIRVTVEPDVVDPDAIASDSQLQGLVAECKGYAEAAKKESYGSPLVAATKAEMTDHERVYVYTGSESGMTAGNWYYWDGTAWASGGVYNSVAVQTDTTLSVAGKAADAKKAGDEIASLKEDLNAESVANNHQVYIPCDDGTLGSTYTVFSKNGRVLTMTNGAPASTLTRICIYGAFDYKSKAPSYDNIPTWYNDPLEAFVVGHRYKFDYKLISGTIDRGEITSDFYFDLRTRDGASQIISGMPNEWVCTFQPEMIAFGVYQFSFNNAVIYLSIIDLTEAEADDPTLDRIEVLEGEVSSIYNIVNYDVSTLGTWETGYYSAEGEKGTSSRFIRTVSGIDVSDAVRVRIEPPTGYAVSACAISEDETVTSYGNANSTDHPENVNVPVTFDSKSYESMLVTCGRFTDSSAEEKAADTEFCGTIKVYLYKVSGTEKGSDRYDYPSFFESQLTTAIAKINTDMNSNKTAGTYGTDVEPFVFITDVHWAENKKHSPGLIKRILDNTPVQTVICGGDFIHSSNATKAGAAKEIRDFNTLITEIPCYEYFCVFGNHDSNSNSGAAVDVQFTKAEQYNLLYSPFANRSNVHWIWEDVPSIMQSEPVKNDYYLDHARTRTRYLCLDWNNPMSGDRAAWITSVLAKDDGYRVVIVYHGIYLGSTGELTPEHTTIMTLAEPYKSKIVALFTGHAHMDAVEDYYGDGSVPVILTSCDTFRAERMTEGTLDEQCFDVAVIDYGQSKIKLTRIGRGTDREVAISLS